MSKKIKNQRQILAKLGIESLNTMQEEARLAIHSTSEIVILSPTGTGKTLAFLLPIIAELDETSKEVQALIITPTRELTIQIEQVIREMGTGYKVDSAYGGRSFSKDKIALKHRPAILVGTPGRVAAHLRRTTFSADSIKTLILDEFDKSLEVGFEDEMCEIIEALPNIEKKILTSATKGVDMPEFVGLDKPVFVNHLEQGVPKLAIKAIISPEKDKLETLFKTLCHLGNQTGIVFCNFKASIQRVSDYLTERGIPHGCFYGGLEQNDREQALIKFRNGTNRIILATDLAARGIDVPEIDYIVHYHLPLRKEEFTHRNGRTARMHSEGTAYVLQWEKEDLPDFMDELEEEKLTNAPIPSTPDWKTVFISGGRKDKISKGDIAGTFFRKGELKKGELGIIELKNDCAFVAVAAHQTKRIIDTLDNSRLKKRKIRVREI
ncbi:MAG: DEAD/DEAH box helicase [Saprospiraceae bacterium]